MESWRASGVTKKVFCGSHDLNCYTFLRCTKRLGRYYFFHPKLVILPAL